jgi:hypothetical protein
VSPVALVKNYRSGSSSRRAKRSSSSAEGKNNDDGLLLLFFVALGAVVVFSMFDNEYCIVLYWGSYISNLIQPSLLSKIHSEGH